MFRFPLCSVFACLVLQIPALEGNPSQKGSTDAIIHVALRKPSEFFYSLLDECAESAFPNVTEEKVTQRRELFREINQTTIESLDALDDDPAGSLAQFRSCYEMPFEYHFTRCVANLEKDRASASFLKELERPGTIGNTVNFIKDLDFFVRKVECRLGERKAIELIDCSVGFFFELKH